MGQQINCSITFYVIPSRLLDRRFGIKSLCRVETIYQDMSYLLPDIKAFRDKLVKPVSCKPA